MNGKSIIFALSACIFGYSNICEARVAQADPADINLQCNGSYRQQVILNGYRPNPELTNSIIADVNIKFYKGGSIYILALKSENIDWSVSNYQPSPDRSASNLTNKTTFNITTEMKIYPTNQSPDRGKLITNIEINRVTGMIHASKYLIVDSGTQVEQIHGYCSNISGSVNKF